MATLVLTSVQATPTLATRNTAGNVAQPGTPLVVWSPAGNYNDDDGSTQPVTFRTPFNTVTPYSPAFTLSAVCTFTSQYAMEGYDVVASLPIGQNGTLVPILRSAGNHVPAPLPNPPVPVPLQCANFQFDDGLHLPASCPVPFRFAGDFQWKLSFMGLPGEYLGIVTTLSERFTDCTRYYCGANNSSRVQLCSSCCSCGSKLHYQSSTTNKGQSFGNLPNRPSASVLSISSRIYPDCWLRPAIR